ncbi:hypothetical protein SESBI_09328 [Sesbania bispinosa]|nr:hypothetical protein SESBI_09328 [Sesbania bispinosa]
MGSSKIIQIFQREFRGGFKELCPFGIANKYQATTLIQHNQPTKTKKMNPLFFITPLPLLIFMLYHLVDKIHDQVVEKSFH